MPRSRPLLVSQLARFRCIAALAPALMALAAPGVAAARAEKDKDKDRVDDRPTEKLPGVKSRVFELKHHESNDVIRVLRPLGSGVKGTTISESSVFRTITVRDFPENIAAMEDALKRFDVPGPLRPDIELSVRVLIAAPGGIGQYPRELEPVVKQLQATLNYKSYHQINSITLRVKANGGSKGKGVIVVNPPVSSEASTMSYSYGFEDVSLLSTTGGGPVKVQIRRLSYWTGGKILGEADINTGLTLREGERVVVGTASLKDRAMILVLSVKVVK